MGPPGRFLALACPCDRCWLQAAPLWNDHPRYSPWPWRWTARMVKGGSDMWAQLMSFRLKPGKDTSGLREQLQAVEQPDSGLLRTMIMQDQKDPGQFYTSGGVRERGEGACARARPAPPGRVAGPSGNAGRQARGSARVHRSGRCGRVDRIGGLPRAAARYSNPCAPLWAAASVERALQ